MASAADRTLMKMENLMTLREVARMLRLSRQTLYKMLKEGSIPAVKIGSQWRFEREQVRTWLMNRDPELDRETRE
jgi:excisionase family DNA binding protein